MGVIAQELRSTRGSPGFDCFTPSAVDRRVGFGFEVGDGGVENGWAPGTSLGRRIRPLVPNDSSVTRGPLQGNLNMRKIGKDL